MKILHVASFVGNIGDNASHMGFNVILNSFFDSFTVVRLEIRKFYKSYTLHDKQRFDLDFIRYANTFDLLIIGGGGFLDYWVKDSATGTTIDINPKLLEKFSVPTLITSVGCIPHKIVPEENIKKFRSFLDCALMNPKIKIAVRTDGSVKSFQREVGGQYLDDIQEVLDSAFFYQCENPGKVYPIQSNYVAVNITDDQIRMRNHRPIISDVDLYYGEISKSIDYIAGECGKYIVFIPHIYSDLRAISELMSRLDNWLVRTKVAVSPCVQKNEGANYNFALYKNADFILGSRYHANVCPLSFGKNVIGLAALERIQYLYEYLNNASSCVLLEAEFSEKLIATILHANSEHAKPAYLDTLEKSREATLAIYRKIFKDFGMI